jgi:hypothetical protein
MTLLLLALVYRPYYYASTAIVVTASTDRTSSCDTTITVTVQSGKRRAKSGPSDAQRFRSSYMCGQRHVEHTSESLCLQHL